MNRYKPLGWQKDNYRHYLAAKYGRAPSRYMQLKVVPRSEIAESGRTVIDVEKKFGEGKEWLKEEKKMLFPEKTVDMSEVLTPQMVQKLNKEYVASQKEKYEMERPFTRAPGERGIYRGAMVEAPEYDEFGRPMRPELKRESYGQMELKPVTFAVPVPEFADPSIARAARAERLQQREEEARLQEMESSMAKAAEEVDKEQTMQAFIDSLKRPKFEIPTAGAERQVRREVREKVAEVVEKELPTKEVNIELAGLKKAYPSAYEIGAEEGIVTGAARRERRAEELRREAEKPTIEVFSPKEIIIEEPSGEQQKIEVTEFGLATPKSLFGKSGWKPVPKSLWQKVDE